MKLQFESYEEGMGGELKCPSCGNHFLHHDKIEIFEREEDAEKGLHIEIEDGISTTDTNLFGNPSERRHGLLIHFWCEGCQAKPVLSVSQHKGSTYVDFK
ncbi:hypothetical protein [uncultured Desulfosarcina sp.]|uniref:hypothetical protein n=1 Tax=uncultured Desulfosarcina sp. TaxID=218289 RepID=UPI0029C64666|nr:hypothetical protein [uncultured Desulfosarcina sp.]